MKVKDVTNYLESIAPLSLQESYDNSGLLVGDMEDEVSAVLVSLDITNEIIEEAIANKCNLIVAHHPIIFSGIKRLTKNDTVSDILIKAVKNNINLYAIHTNLDNVVNGVNGKIADLIGLGKRKVLLPKSNLYKLAVFTPLSHKEKVLSALFEAGAGYVGEYSNCSFSSKGTGTFKPMEGANPYVGKIDELESVDEGKLELVVPNFSLANVIYAMKESHPYEEVAYDLVPLANFSNFGAGLIGDLKEPMDESVFLQFLQKTFKSKSIRHTDLLKKPIRKVALCGGSGSFLLKNAIKNKADIFITADMKYHQFFDGEGRILIADIGHYESEQFTIDLIGDFLMKKFTNFAIRLTTVNTNPINYL